MTLLGLIHGYNEPYIETINLRLKNFWVKTNQGQHKNNLQILTVEIYKTVNHLNPEYIWEFFKKRCSLQSS